MRRLLTGTIPSPAAGQGFSYCFSQNEAVRLVALMANFTADAVVANRNAACTITDKNGVVAWQSGNNTAVTASQSAVHVFSSQYSAIGTQRGVTASTLLVVPLPDIVIPEGWFFNYVGTNFDVGDQVSNITFAAEYFEDTFDRDRMAAAILAYENAS